MMNLSSGRTKRRGLGKDVALHVVMRSDRLALRRQEHGSHGCRGNRDTASHARDRERTRFLPIWRWPLVGAAGHARGRRRGLHGVHVRMSHRGRGRRCHDRRYQKADDRKGRKQPMKQRPGHVAIMSYVAAQEKSGPLTFSPAPSTKLGNSLEGIIISVSLLLRVRERELMLVQINVLGRMVLCPTEGVCAVHPIHCPASASATPPAAAIATTRIGGAFQAVSARSQGAQARNRRQSAKRLASTGRNVSLDSPREVSRTLLRHGDADRSSLSPLRRRTGTGT
jgi:hypothetical protein